jgi:hypothetical protein
MFRVLDYSRRREIGKERKLISAVKEGQETFANRQARAEKGGKEERSRETHVMSIDLGLELLVPFLSTADVVRFGVIFRSSARRMADLGSFALAGDFVG